MLDVAQRGTTRNRSQPPAQETWIGEVRNGTDEGRKGSMLELPAELRGLVAFLEQDGRPSAIVYGADEVVYRNAACRSLVTARELQLALGSTRDMDGFALEAQSITKINGAGDWRQTEVLAGWRTLVKHGDTAPTSSPNDSQKPESTPPNGVFDWTRFDIPDLSPWLRFVRDFSWSTTSLGAMSTWSPLLKTTVLYVMAHPQPRALLLGRDPQEQIFVFNEACIPLFGGRSRFGMRVKEAWADLYEFIRPSLEEATSGKAVTLLELQIMLERAGAVEETYFDSSLLPIAGHDGRAIGILDELTEITQTVRGKHRRRSIFAISSRIAAARTLKELWRAFLEGLETAVEDVAYAVLYSVQTDVPNSCAVVAESNLKLEGTVGLPAESAPAFTAACLQAWRSRETVMLNVDDGTLPSGIVPLNPDRAFGDEVRTVAAWPNRSAVSDEGVLVIGLNPRRPYDEEYETWTHLVADLLRKTATLVMLPEEQRRAQQIANELNDALAQQLRTTTQQVERSEAKFRRMAESAPQGMYMFNPEGKTLHVNDRYLAIIGETREQHGTRDLWKDQVHEEDVDGFMSAWETLLQKKPATIEYRLNRRWHTALEPNGDQADTDTWLLANAFPDIDPDSGKVVAVMGWLTDISQTKLAEKLQAQRLSDALENKRQSENFIDMTSHEMRNPLSAILQSADSIVSALTSAGMPLLGEDMSLTPDTADEIVDAAQTIILCAQHQKRIVDDILTLSKLDASLLVISPDKVQPPTLVKKALEMYKSEIAHAGIDATLCVEQSYKDLDVDWLILDSSRLLQVIINLLTNAIKFTQYAETRKIDVCVGASPDRPTGKHHNVKFIPIRQRPNQPAQAEWGDGEDVYLQIAVTDSGSGLSEDDISMYTRFTAP